MIKLFGGADNSDENHDDIKVKDDNKDNCSNHEEEEAVLEVNNIVGQWVRVGVCDRISEDVTFKLFRQAVGRNTAQVLFRYWNVL